MIDALLLGWGVRVMVLDKVLAGCNGDCRARLLGLICTACALRAPFLALLGEIDWGSGTIKITMKTMKITLKNSSKNAVALLLHEAERENYFLLVRVQRP